MSADKDHLSNAFKRVLTVAMKTIAEDPELTVAFGNEPPGLAGNRARLPQISNDLKPGDIAIVRGLSDSFALRISNHNGRFMPAISRRARMPAPSSKPSSRRGSRRWAPMP